VGSGRRLLRGRALGSYAIEFPTLEPLVSNTLRFIHGALLKPQIQATNAGIRSMTISDGINRTRQDLAKARDGRLCFVHWIRSSLRCFRVVFGG
jgi:hypothetical protein